MKKAYRDPELEIERFADEIDCLTISEGDHDQQGPTSQGPDDT